MLPRDPETLRIPAFMRKRNISSRLKRPLLLTALDRKNAGLPLTGKPGKIIKKRISKPKITLTKAIKARKRKPTPIANIAKPIGEITHYYEKIQVGVIKLSKKLEVGDMITYFTCNDSYEQIVESMEIDRKPVFAAGRGKEIGLKLYKAPRVGSTVFINQ